MTRPYQHLPRCPDRIAVLDVETVAPSAPDGQSFPPWPSHQPVVASILSATAARYGQWQFELESVNFEDGKVAIERVSQLVENRALVTFNGRGFDVPVLAMTAMRHRQFDGSGLATAWRANRFGSDHLDVADLVGNYGGARGASLEALCKALGIPVKLDAHGSEVGAMIEAGRMADVIAYCEQDVASTLLLFAMVQGLRCTEPGYAGSLISQFGRWLRDQKLEHLRPFERIDGHAALERLSLVHMMEEGIASLSHRTHLKFVTGKPGDTGLMAPGFSDFPA